MKRKEASRVKASSTALDYLSTLQQSKGYVVDISHTREQNINTCMHTHTSIQYTERRREINIENSRKGKRGEIQEQSTATSSPSLFCPFHTIPHMSHLRTLVYAHVIRVHFE
mmetsp:Transcript_20466/g.52549  ORF Transcript_20466/g.52549 Transcript_20466/m.52549 type:complete len:112 (+) Transcript_20466:106-441(+)